jgi:hypothetical protein
MLIATMSPAASGQVLIVRVMSGAVGIAGAEVALWGPAGRMASARTTGSGIARLEHPSAAEPNVYVTARRLGFAPARVAPFPGADSLTVHLSAVAVSLPVLAVESRPLRCPVMPDSAARELWTAAASRYGSGQDTLNFGFVRSVARERVPRDQRGYGEALGVPSRGGWYPPPPPMRQRVAPVPYATFVRRVTLMGTSAQWQYSPLHTFAAWHFADRSFGQRHDFAMLGRTAHSTIIGYCPRQRSDAEIQGELEIGDDSLFRAGRWTFLVRHDDEDAGAEATFGVGVFEGRRLLVAIRGSSWRSAGQGHYEQERFELTGWRFGHSEASARVDWSTSGDANVPPSCPPTMAREGIEPPTRGFSVRCSTN